MTFADYPVTIGLAVCLGVALLGQGEAQGARWGQWQNAQAQPAPADALSRTEWAGKLPGGPVRAVFIAPDRTCPDAYELMERFDIEGNVVPISRGGTREFGIRGHYWPELMKSPEDALDDVRRALAWDWEAVVMSSEIGWRGYPEDIRRSITTGVAKGKMLMMCVSDDLRKDLADAGLSLEATDIGASRLPFANDEEGAAKIYRCGRGRVVHFVCSAAMGDDCEGYLLSPSTLQSDFEYSAARAGWFLYRGARPHSAECIRSSCVKDGKLVVSASAGCRLQVTLRRSDTYQVLFTKRLRAKAGGVVTVSLPWLAAGDYQAELVASADDGRTLDWDAVKFARTGPVGVTAVTADKEVVKAGETLTCSVQAKGPTDGLRMIARWYDNWNRLLLQTREMPFSDNVTIIVPNNSLSVLNRVEVSLVSDRGVEANGSVELAMPENVRPAGDFYVLYWNTGHLAALSWRIRLRYDALRRDGAADAFSDVLGGTARNAAVYNMRTVPYAANFCSIKLAEHLFNEDWLSATEKGAREAARKHRRYGALAYTLGDENYVSAFEPQGRFSNAPTVWSKFIEYLKDTYPDIASLNRQWGTEFADWDGIWFQTEKEMLRSTDNPSAWVDFRMFVSRNFAAAHQRMRRAIREEHPGAIVGWDGTEQYSSYDGYDWWQFTRDMDLTQTYHYYLMPGAYSNKIFNGQAIKSFRPDASLSGCWLNNADLRYGGRYVPWYLLLNGWNSVWWWHASYVDRVNGAFDGGPGLHPIVQAMGEVANEIKRGPATLLAHARKQIDPIAVHYSENNWHASTIESGIGEHVNNLGLKTEYWTATSLPMAPDMKELWGSISPKGHYAVAAKNFYLLLHDLGFQPRTMARQEIEAGELSASMMKVLILPFAVSLSNAEVEKIKAFVENGGLLIADYRCGVRDLHGRLRDKPVLDEVFGIGHDSLEVKRARGIVAADIRPVGVAQGGEIETIFHDPLVEGTAHPYAFHNDGTPALLLNSYGEGKAIYLNFDLYDYDRIRRQGTERDVRELFRSLISVYGGLQATSLIEYQHGHPISHTELTHFHDGNTMYLGVLPDFTVDDKSPWAVRVPFPAGMHVYDVRRKSYLGDSGSVVEVLEPGQPKLYAALPYKVTGIAVQCPREVRRGEDIKMDLQVTGSGRKRNIGPHAARIEVIRPDGSNAGYHARTVYLPRGAGLYSFAPALNEPAGRWKLEVTESISGSRACAEVDIR